MTAVTIGVGEKFNKLARLSAEEVRAQTGLPTVILNESHMKLHDLKLPHHLKFHLFDFVDDDAIMFFDADTLFIKPFNPNLVENNPVFVCVRDLIDKRHIIEDARLIQIPLERYFNSGFFIIQRQYHKKLLKEAKTIAYTLEGKSKFKDQSALNLAVYKLNLEVLYLPTYYNVLRGDQKENHDQTVMIHFDQIEKLQEEAMLDHFLRIRNKFTSSR